MAEKNGWANMLTKKDLLEAIEDMPMDAPIKYGSESKYGHLCPIPLEEVICFKKDNEIVLC